MPLRFLIPLFAALLSLTSAAEQRQLAAGSPAPPLRPEKWLKGIPVAAFEPGKVYLVECWATWCGPCVAAIPHLNDLHTRFQDKGLIVIGVNVMGDPEDKAAAFVARQGEKMAYRVAYDGKSGNIASHWLKAVGARGIPHAFLVRGGKLLWHGHPAELTEDNVGGVLRGGTIATKEAAERDGPSEAVMAYRKARLEILGLLSSNKADDALAAITRHEGTLAGTDPADPDVLRGMAFSVKGEHESSLFHYRAAQKKADGRGDTLFRVALGLLDYGSARDSALALECARAAAAAKGAPPVARHLLARAESAAGNQDTAIAILEKLVAEEDDPSFREELRRLRGAE